MILIWYVTTNITSTMREIYNNNNVEIVANILEVVNITIEITYSSFKDIDERNFPAFF